MQRAVRVILAVALAWQPVLGLAGGACAAAAPAASACSAGANCCCGDSCSMAATAMRCGCGGEETPAAPAPAERQSGRVDHLVALSPALVVAPVFLPYSLTSRSHRDAGTPRRDGPSIQSILCVWLT